METQKVIEKPESTSSPFDSSSTNESNDHLIIPLSKTFDEDSMEKSNEQEADMPLENNTSIGRNECDGGFMSPILPIDFQVATRRKSMDLLAMFESRKSERATMILPPSIDEVDLQNTSRSETQQETQQLLSLQDSIASKCVLQDELGFLEGTKSTESEIVPEINDHSDQMNRSIDEETPKQMDHEERESQITHDNNSMEMSVRFTAEDMQRTTEELGASRNAFIQRLRGAAFRRKMNFTRSRDSLVAKEREHREAIAAFRAERQQQEEQDGEKTKATNQRRSSMPEKFDYTFKARPVPVTNGLAGNGGLVGVPKVEKRSTTTPFSPLLGARRQLRGKSSRPAVVENNGRQILQEGKSTTFHARPLPKTNGQMGAAGQAGVPKVPKRPVTIPLSPLLGARRNQSTVPMNGSKLKIVEGGNSNTMMHEGKQKTSIEPCASEHSLLGLDICYQKENDEQAVATPAHNSNLPFIPHSTARAQKRAEYEMQREKNEARRKEEERQKRRERIQILRKELGVLRKII